MFSVSQVLVYSRLYERETVAVPINKDMLPRRLGGHLPWPGARSQSTTFGEKKSMDTLVLTKIILYSKSIL